VRLLHDLELNLPGAALAVDLLDADRAAAARLAGCLGRVAAALRSPPGTAFPLIRLTDSASARAPH
jgi:hypothetical protein